MRVGLAGVVLAILGGAGRGLRGAALGTPHIAPNGIVSFELAGTPEKAQQILDLWAATGKLDAARGSVGWDFAFIVVYGLTLLLWVRWAQGRFAGGWWRRLGILAIALIVAAAAADVAENVALYRVFDMPTAANTAWARRFAILKFGLLGVAVGYVLAAPIRLGLRRIRGSPQQP